MMEIRRKKEEIAAKGLEYIGKVGQLRPIGSMLSGCIGAPFVRRCTK